MNAFDPEIGITGGGVLVVVDVVKVPAAPVPAGISVTPAVGTDTLELPAGVLPDQALGLPVAWAPVAAAAWRASAAWPEVCVSWSPAAGGPEDAPPEWSCGPAVGVSVSATL
jgi:hypothetical protein